MSVVYCCRNVSVVCEGGFVMKFEVVCFKLLIPASGLWPVTSWHKSEDKDAETKESGSPQKSCEAEEKGNEVSIADSAAVEEGSQVIKREKDEENA